MTDDLDASIRWLPSMVEALLSGDFEPARCAAGALGTWLQTLPPERLLAADERVRAAAWRRELPAWSAIQPAEVEGLCRGPWWIELLGLFSFHPNGRVREQAVDALARSLDVRAFGFLLARTCDWVSPVRSRAEAGVLAFCQPEYVSALVRCLPLVGQLETRKRGQTSRVLDSIFTTLCARECREEVLQAVSSEDQKVSEMCLRIIGKLNPEEAQPLFARSLRSRNPFVRWRAAAHLIHHPSGVEFRELVELLKDDSFLPMRRLALQTAVEHSLKEKGELLEGALLDRSASLRDLARFYLRREGDFDAPAFYRAELERTRESALPPVLLGLGETGGAPDFEFLTPYLRADSAAVRKAALAAAARLDFARAAPLLEAALKGESPGLSRIAARHLALRPELVSESTLIALVTASERPFVARNALGILLHRGKWDRLAGALLGYTSADSKLAAMGESVLRTWLARYNISGAQPTAAQLARARSLMDATAERLPARLRRELGAIFQLWL